MEPVIIPETVKSALDDIDWSQVMDTGRAIFYVNRYVMKASEVSPTPSDADGRLRDLNLIALKMLGIHNYDKADFNHPRLTDDMKLHARVAIEQIFNFTDK